jgi:uncharacterized protein (TIGR02266 family)
MDGPENRKVPRAELEVEVTLESESNFYSGITGNVSTGGLFVATYTPPPKGAEVALDLKLEGAPEPLQLRGVVLWVRGPERATDLSPPGCGVRWVELQENAVTAITRFVDKRDTIFYDDDD